MVAVRSWSSRTFSSVRRYRNYRLFFCGQLFSLCGTWMQDAALPWLVLQETHSGFDVGLLVGCRFAPYLLLGLHSGVLADRFDNRRLLVAANAASMSITSLLAVLVFSNRTPLWAILLLATLGGIAMTYEGPSRHALMYQLVGRKELPNAISLNGSLFNAARAVGPAVGGVIIAGLGIGWCFAFNAASFLAILVALLMMRPEELIPVARAAKTQTVRAIADGFAFIRRSQPVLVVLGMVLVGSTIGFNFRVLVPVFADRALDGDAAGFGVLYGSFGLGALAGGLVVASKGRATWRLLIVGALLFNGAVLAVSPIRSALPAAGLMAIGGAGFAVWLATGQSILQLTTPDDVRGRVISVYLLILGGLQPIGGILTGWLADTGGITFAIAFAGIAGVIATLAAAAWVRAEMPSAPQAEVTLVGEL